MSWSIHCLNAVLTSAFVEAPVSRITTLIINIGFIRFVPVGMQTVDLAPKVDDKTSSLVEDTDVSAP